MALYEVVYLDLNKAEVEEKYKARKSNSASIDYESYITEKDELTIKPLSQHEMSDIEFSSIKSAVHSKDDFKNKKLRLPCHMNETLNFCHNVCRFKNFCSHKK